MFACFFLSTHYTNFHITFIRDNLVLCTDYTEPCPDAQGPCEDGLHCVYPTIISMTTGTCCFHEPHTSALYIFNSDVCTSIIVGRNYFLNVFLLLNQLSNNDFLLNLITTQNKQNSLMHLLHVHILMKMYFF